VPWQNHLAERSQHVDELLHVQLNLPSDPHPLKVGSLTKIKGMNSLRFGKTKHSSLPSTSLLENSQLQVLGFLLSLIFKASDHLWKCKQTTILILYEFSTTISRSEVKLLYQRWKEWTLSSIMIFRKMWRNFPSMMLQNQFSMGLMASIESWPINLSYAIQHRMLGDNYWLED